MRGWMGTLGLLAVAMSGPCRALETPPFEKPPQVTIQKTPIGSVLANAEGKTLYSYVLDQTSAGAVTSRCVDTCATSWPPFLAAADAKPIGDWSIIRRPGGELQWTFKNKPLYTFAADPGPGEAKGDQVMQYWQAAHYVPPAPKLPLPGAAHVQLYGEEYLLADNSGMTLYTFEKDQPGHPACSAACLNSWPPLEAPALAQPVGDFSIVTRDDGARQWAYKNRPLYRSDDDGRPGETNGAGADGLWRTVQP